MHTTTMASLSSGKTLSTARTRSTPSGHATPCESHVTKGSLRDCRFANHASTIRQSQALYHKASELCANSMRPDWTSTHTGTPRACNTHCVAPHVMRSPLLTSTAALPCASATTVSPPQLPAMPLSHHRLTSTAALPCASATTVSTPSCDTHTMARGSSGRREGSGRKRAPSMALGMTKTLAGGTQARRTAGRGGWRVRGRVGHSTN